MDVHSSYTPKLMERNYSKGCVLPEFLFPSEFKRKRHFIPENYPLSEFERFTNFVYPHLSIFWNVYSRLCSVKKILRALKNMPNLIKLNFFLLHLDINGH